MSIAAGNKTFMFALEKSLNAVEEDAKTRIKDDITELIKDTSNQDEHAASQASRIRAFYERS